MRSESSKSIVEVGSSMVMAMVTGLCAFGGLAFADYAFLPLQTRLSGASAVLLVFGLVNLPLFALWSHQTAIELEKLGRGSLSPVDGKTPCPALKPRACRHSGFHSIASMARTFSRGTTNDVVPFSTLTSSNSLVGMRRTRALGRACAGERRWT